MRGDADFAAVAPWMIQGGASLEPEPPRAMPSWMAPAAVPSSPLPPYGDQPFQASVVPQPRAVPLAPAAGGHVPGSTLGPAHEPGHLRPAAHGSPHGQLHAVAQGAQGHLPAAGHGNAHQAGPGGAHVHLAAPPHGGPHGQLHARAHAAEPSLAPPPSVNWGQVGALPSLRPLMSIRPTHLPESAEVAALRASLDAALAASAKARQDILESCERNLVDLALVVAARVVGRELRADPSLVALWVREGVAGLVAEDDVSVTVSPDVADALGAGGGVGYKLTVDPTLAPLSCVVRGRYGRVDVGAEARMRLLAEALGAPEAP